VALRIRQNAPRQALASYRGAYSTAAIRTWACQQQTVYKTAEWLHNSRFGSSNVNKPAIAAPVCSIEQGQFVHAPGKLRIEQTYPPPQAYSPNGGDRQHDVHDITLATARRHNGASHP